MADILRGQCPIEISARKFTNFQFITVKITAKYKLFEENKPFLLADLTVINWKFCKFSCRYLNGALPSQGICHFPYLKSIENTLFRPKQQDGIAKNRKKSTFFPGKYSLGPNYSRLGNCQNRFSILFFSYLIRTFL